MLSLSIALVSIGIGNLLKYADDHDLYFLVSGICLLINAFLYII